MELSINLGTIRNEMMVFDELGWIVGTIHISTKLSEIQGLGWVVVGV